MTKRNTKVFALVAVFAMCIALAAAMLFMPVGVETVSAANENVAAIFYIGSGEVTDTENGYDYVAATASSPETYTFADHAKGWSVAHNKAAGLMLQNVAKKKVKVVLLSDWNAKSDLTYTTSFGSGEGFLSGTIQVGDKSAVNMILDLNGNDINRKLTAARSAGYVLQIYAGSTLEIADSVGGSVITGGNSVGSYGGIRNAGTLTLTSGKITGNKVDSTGAVYGAGLSNVGRFTMNGGEISGNLAVSTTNIYGGGSYNNGTFIMNGGKIIGNTARASAQAFGAGLGVLGGMFTMNGGEISENIAESEGKNGDTKFVGGDTRGGAIWLYQGTVNIQGTAKLKNNIVRTYIPEKHPNGTVIKLGLTALAQCFGGAIMTHDGFTSTINLSGQAEISGNKTLVYRQANWAGDPELTGAMGGAVYAGNLVTFNMRGGKIIGNYSGQSAVEVKTKFVLSGGEISGNIGKYVGAVHMDAGAVMELSGSPVVKDNYAFDEEFGYGEAVTDGDGNPKKYGDKPLYKSNFLLGGASHYITVAGKLTNAEIHIYTGSKGGSKAEGDPIAKGYSAKNSVDKDLGNGTKYNVTTDPSEFFFSDRAGKSFVLLESGDVAETSHKLEFKAKYATGETLAKVDGYAFETDYLSGATLGTELVDGTTPVTLTKLDGSALDSGVANAGIYEMKATVQASPKVEVKYIAVVRPKKMTLDNTRAEIGEVARYDGTQKKPTFTLYEKSATTPTGDVAFDAADYTAAYGENVNAGKGTISVTYKNNYCGTVVYEFTISPNAAVYTIAWKYKDDEGNWTNLPSDGKVFTYDAEDYSLRVRAELTAGGKTVEVYAKDTSDSNNNTTNMYLSFSGIFGGVAQTAVLNAAEYSVIINGDTNYSFNAEDGGRVAKVVVEPKEFAFTARDFMDKAASENEAENILWVEDLGGERTAKLYSNAIYYNPAAEFNSDYGAKVTIGDKFNSYVRYTGDPHTIKLNPSFRLGEKTLGDYMSSFTDVIYQGNKNMATGNPDVEYPRDTTVVLVLNGNWKSQSSDIRFTKRWYIVTINNILRSALGSADTAIEDRVFGSSFVDGLFRPEHGDRATYTITKEGGASERFAAEFTARGTFYYETTESNGVYVPDETKPIGDTDYYRTVMEKLGVGKYTLDVYVPKYTVAAAHTHWWGNEAATESINEVYFPISRRYEFEVKPYEIVGAAIGDTVTMEVVSGEIPYSGAKDNTPSLKVVFNGATLVEGVDYKLTSDNVVVGDATFSLHGIGNFAGNVVFENSYKIIKAHNGWKGVPNIMYWTFGDYKKEVNYISASPVLLDRESDMWFKVTRDEAGKQAVKGLERISLKNNIVSDAVAAELSKLNVGTYYLFAIVDEGDNYYELAQNGVPFKVFLGVNAWETTPTVKTWIVGDYTAGENAPVAKSRFGAPIVVVTDKDGKEYFRSSGSDVSLDALANAPIGKYTLTAMVDGASDYSGLVLYTLNFDVFERPGLPWWGTLLITVGSLLAVAVILLILWKKGVFQILTERIVVAIRTKASVDATIASVRAAKAMEDGRRLVAEARRRERIDAARKKREAERALPAEERAAALEAKALAAEEKAEKNRARIKAMKEKAEKMRSGADKGKIVVEIEGSDAKVEAETVDAAGEDKK